MAENKDKIDLDIDNDQDIDYQEAKKDPEFHNKIKKQKNNIEQLSKISDIDVERAILYLLTTVYNNTIIETVSQQKIKQEFFLSEIGSKIFNIIYNLWTSWKVDYILIKNEFEINAKDDKEKNAFKEFFNFKWFLPKKDLFIEYIELLTKNFERNWLNNLVVNLEKAIKQKDKSKIEYLKHEVSNYELANNDDNPDLWLVTNEYLWTQAIEWTNWWYKTQNVILKTWYKTFDNQIGWFEKWQFIVFAARPSVWKSISLINTMYSMVQEGHYCLYVSAEMYAKYVYSRWQSIELNINNNKIKAPFKLNENEKKKVIAFNEKFKKNHNARFFFDNVVTARDIEIMARQIKSQNWWKLDAIFVDYLWKLYPNNLNTNRSRNEIVTDISKELFELAWKLNIVMITASQLSRESSKSADQASLVKPKMSDLRDSWAVEQDADIIIWLTRNVDEGINCVTEDMKTDFNRHVIKNRNGELWDFTFDFHPTIQKLVDKYDVFEKSMETPNDITKKKEAKEQSEKIKNILKEEEWGNFSVWTDDIFWD